MPWLALELEVAVEFSELADRRDEIEQALEGRRQKQREDRREAKALGASGVVRKKRQPLEQRLDELEKKAQRHFAAAWTEFEDRGLSKERLEHRRWRAREWYKNNKDKRRASVRKQRERDRKLIRAIRAARPVAPIEPVGRPAWLEVRLAKRGA